jgi:YidC/Oxa1 family membrane protein insertase
MDSKRLIVGMLLAMAIIFAWPNIYVFVGTKLGYNMTPPKVVDSTTQPTTQSSPTTNVSEPSATPATTVPTAQLHATPTTQPIVAELGSAADNDKTYKMDLLISPMGAGLNSVQLNEFKQAARSKELYTFQLPYPDGGAASLALATQSVTINGTTIDLSGINWSLESSDQNTATYYVVLSDITGPIAKVRKTFQVTPSSDPSSGYEVAITQSFENLTDHPLSVRAILNGTNVPPRESDRGGDRNVIGGYLQRGMINVAHDVIESFSKSKLSKDYTKDSEGDPLVWVGQASIYFQGIVHTLPLTSSDVAAPYIGNVTAQLLNPDSRPDEHEIALTITTTDLSVAPKHTLSLPMRVFFGPRQRKLLNNSYYSAFPLSFNDTLVLTSGFCGYCTFQWLVNALVWLLAAFHWIIGGFMGHGDWGLSIIALVVMVRILLHPITRRSQVSMSKMTKMGPEMEKLKKKYADNKDELNKAMMGFYKEQGATPVLGCLPMLLQTPIWIALWQALQTTFDLRQAPFLWGFTWIHDLSKPDHLITFPAVPLLFGWTISAFNLLPILLAIVFFFQTKFQPKPAALTKEQEQQQKMMQWMMPLLFPLMLYNGPSGLNLYIFTSTAIGIIEMKIIRDHIKQREEAENAGRVIVDAGKKFKGGGKALPTDQPAKPRGLMGWVAQLQERAEQVRREADKRGK